MDRSTTACLTIRADVDDMWKNTMAMLAPWRANGTVVGIFLGEQCYHGVSLQNLTYVCHGADTSRLANLLAR